MNAVERDRLTAVRNAIAGMDDDETPSSSETLSIIGRGANLFDAEKKPVPTHINMGTVLAERRFGGANGYCETVGCIAGTTVALYPAEAKAEWHKEFQIAEQTNEYPDRFATVGRVLGLTSEMASSLFFAQDSEHKHDLERITKEEVLSALDAAIAGEKPSKLWTK